MSKNLLMVLLIMVVVGSEAYHSFASDIVETVDTPKILVLNYHQIGNTSSPLSVNVNDFEAQMKFLVDSGCITITPAELYAGLNGEIELPQKPVLLTFDDGYLDNYTNAFPILKKYNLRATIFIIPAFTSVYPGYLTWEQLKEM